MRPIDESEAQQPSSAASAVPLRPKLESGTEAAVGLWAGIASSFAAELIAVPGIDYICVDQQHGLVDYAAMVDMFRAIELHRVAPLTRVPANETWLISRALDAGAHGVVVPMVSTAAEADAAVAACRYPPRGVRSFGPIRSTISLGARHRDVLGDGPLCFVMVETGEGVDNVDAIAATPGLDGIYIGPADLALGLGLEPTLDATDPVHSGAIDTILATCVRHGIVAGIQCSSGAAARAQRDRGFLLVTFGKDTALLRDAATRELAELTGQRTAKAGYS